MAKFDKTKLGKWSILIRKRDGGLCQMCNDKPGAYKLEAHHIYPKHYKRYSKRAYEMDNGIALCERCHLDVVHATAKNWKRFTGMFRQYMRRKAIKAFNEKNTVRRSTVRLDILPRMNSWDYVNITVFYEKNGIPSPDDLDD